MTKSKKVQFFLPESHDDQEAHFARLIDEAAQTFISDPGFDLTRLPAEASLWSRDRDGSYFFAEVSEDCTSTPAELIGVMLLKPRGNAVSH